MTCRQYFSVLGEISRLQRETGNQLQVPLPFMHTYFPDRSSVFQSGLGVKSVFTSFRHTLAVAPTKTAPTSAYRIDSKKILRPGEY